ncbi:MAG: FhaA domain-containing protein [Candidatus Promineifilaceae bacterium]|nr:FhaA domain-containing protein [Candidatus Promineifilaceae bacterium]
MKQKGLSHFEALAQELVEGKIGRMLGGRLEPLDVANQLAKVMEDVSNQDQQPACYVIGLSRRDYQILINANPNLADEIAQAAWAAWKTSTGQNGEKPSVILKEDPKVRRYKLSIEVDSYSVEDSGSGNTIIRGSDHGRLVSVAQLLSLDAFLIIQGRRHVPLSKPLITIGRRTENDIVLDLPAVSRRHAQIRWRFGRFVLYDVSTRGRTMVNGHPVREHVLKSGDVIALSDALLIYGEGLDASLPRDASRKDDTKTLIRSPKT